MCRVVYYDEDSNVVCPVCGRPMAATVVRTWEWVPCWVHDGEFEISWGGDSLGAKVTKLTCSGCGETVLAPFTLEKVSREKQVALI